MPDPYRQYWSIYLAMGNNPISRIDPNGGEDVNGDGIDDGNLLNEVSITAPSLKSPFIPQGLPTSQISSSVLFDVVYQSSVGMTDFSNANMALTVGGAIYGAMEGATASQGYWLGENGKYYSQKWGGNQYTGSRAGALKAANTYRLAGNATIIASVAIGG